jgi:hypothetical protein
MEENLVGYNYQYVQIRENQSNLAQTQYNTSNNEQNKQMKTIYIIDQREYDGNHYVQQQQQQEQLQQPLQQQEQLQQPLQQCTQEEEIRFENQLPLDFIRHSPTQQLSNISQGETPLSPISPMSFSAETITTTHNKTSPLKTTDSSNNNVEIKKSHILHQRKSAMKKNSKKPAIEPYIPLGKSTLQTNESYIPTKIKDNDKKAKSSRPSNINDSSCNEMNKISEERSPSINNPSPLPPKRKRGSYLNEKEIESESDVTSIISTTSNRAKKNKNRSPTDGLSIHNGISYRKIHRPISYQNTIDTIKPNNIISDATKTVVLSIIRNKDYDINFKSVIETFVNRVTENVFSKPNRDLSTICNLMITVEEENKKEAILLCINLLSLTLSTTKIQYCSIIDWCTSLCTVLNQVFCHLNTRITPTSNRETLTKRFLEEYINVTIEIKQQLQEALSKYEDVFQDLTNISDWATYILFGINSTGKHDSSIDTSVLINNILRAWVILEQLPINIQGNECDRLNDIMWCIPLIQFTNLGGFCFDEKKVNKPPVVTLEHYLKL